MQFILVEKVYHDDGCWEEKFTPIDGESVEKLKEISEQYKADFLALKTIRDGIIQEMELALGAGPARPIYKGMNSSSPNYEVTLYKALQTQHASDVSKWKVESAYHQDLRIKFFEMRFSHHEKAFEAKYKDITLLNEDTKLIPYPDEFWKYIQK